MADLTLEDLKKQRILLKSAIRSGVLTITHGDKTIKHRTMREMQTALSDLEAEIGDLEGRPKRRIRYTSIRKAL